MPRRRLPLVALGGLVAVVAILLVVRYVTFDPQRFARDVEDEITLFRPSMVETMRGIASASSMASAVPLITQLPTDTTERIDRYKRTMSALHARFHTGSGPCERYPTMADGVLPESRLDEVADAIILADLASRIDALVHATVRWSREDDAPAHRADKGTELTTWFTETASLWSRLGIAMHRGAVEKAVHDIADIQVPARGEPLQADEETRGKELWKRYGPGIIRGGLRVAERKRYVDLHASQLRLIEPGMSRAAVRGRLGKADEDGTHWRYPKDGAEVSFDAQDHVTGIAVTIDGWRSRVVIDGKEVPHPDETSLRSAMGTPPLRDAEGEAGETVLVYDAGANARLLVFTGASLTRVELWRRDLVVSPSR